MPVSRDACLDISPGQMAPIRRKHIFPEIALFSIISLLQNMRIMLRVISDVKCALHYHELSHIFGYIHDPNGCLSHALIDINDFS